MRQMLNSLICCLLGGLLFSNTYGQVAQEAMDEPAIKQLAGNSCNLDASFNAAVHCFLDSNEQVFVHLSIIPTGPSQNAYQVDLRNLTAGTTFSPLYTALGGLGIYSTNFPYVAGQQYQIRVGTWSPTNSNCTWIESRQTVIPDANSNWFPSAASFTGQGTNQGPNHSSIFEISAQPNNLSASSAWHIRVLKNGAYSNWRSPADFGANPDGNSPLTMYFDCQSSNTPAYTIDTLLQNIDAVQVRRTTYGTCSASSNSLIWQYANCGEGTGKSVTSTRQPAAKAAMRIFPNPSQGLVQLHFPAATERQIEVLSPNGRRVLPLRQTTEAQVALNLADLPAGVYVIRAIGASEVLTERVVKR